MEIRGKGILGNQLNGPRSPDPLLPFPAPGSDADHLTTTSFQGRPGCESGTSSSLKPRIATKADSMCYRTLPQQSMKGRGWGLYCPQFESEWLSYSLHIFQSMLSSGNFWCQGAKESGLWSINFMASQEPMSLCLPKVRCRSGDAAGHCFHSADYQFFLEGAHSSFPASYGTFSLKGRSNRHCI